MCHPISLACAVVQCTTLLPCQAPSITAILFTTSLCNPAQVAERMQQLREHLAVEGLGHFERGILSDELDRLQDLLPTQN